VGSLSPLTIDSKRLTDIAAPKIRKE
jgi:hypothetical protein